MFIWGGNSAPVIREECCCPRELYGEKAGEKDGENTALSVPDKGGSSGDADAEAELSSWPELYCDSSACPVVIAGDDGEGAFERLELSGLLLRSPDAVLRSVIHCSR